MTGNAQVQCQGNSTWTVRDDDDDVMYSQSHRVR